MNSISGVSINIKGIVQGVGFRPFVYNLATRMGLKGWVRNTSAGVDIEIDGSQKDLDEFLNALRNDAPPLAMIDEILIHDKQPGGYSAFSINDSTPIPDAFQPVSPDIAVCKDCLSEMYDPDDRRYRYPFINCTNCGPRFTIIEDIPYDRPNTTMSQFKMCPVCEAEYNNPQDRRFHAQPIACPACGPKVWLVSEGIPIPENLGDIAKTQYLFSKGKIVAIKGIGGFHLACDASNPAAVDELRLRKLRVDKPFAIMMPDLATIQQHCEINDFEARLLASPQHPIVLLKRRIDSPLPPSLAPHQQTLGVMLPYTPLHHLLFSTSPENTQIETPSILVMTSGNKSEEPIAITNDEATHRLSSLADAFLLHNRPIRTRCDDSVVRSDHTQARIYSIRRSRGYVPFPIHIPWKLPPILATGAELKNTFCLTADKYAFLSHHIGDMENYETLQSYEDGLDHFQRLFRIDPEVIACDKHPNYLSTRLAMDLANKKKLPLVEVQHHHAHIAACMAEHQFREGEKVIGVAFDGTGYGDDGAIWGGEFLLASYHNYERMYHLEYMPLPGGDASIRKPARISFAYLWKLGYKWEPVLPCYEEICVQEQLALHSQLEHSINSPLNSSVGRLFDAVSALLGVRPVINYEAQAAIELEALCEESETGVYPFELIPINASSSQKYPVQIDLSLFLGQIIEDIYHEISKPKISSRFHNSIANMVRIVCLAIRDLSGVNTVALSGGVWQNLTLLSKSVLLLEEEGFNVITHSLIPANDGGLSLGQAIVAYHSLLKS